MICLFPLTFRMGVGEIEEEKINASIFIDEFNSIVLVLHSKICQCMWRVKITKNKSCLIMSEEQLLKAILTNGRCKEQQVCVCY